MWHSSFLPSTTTTTTLQHHWQQSPHVPNANNEVQWNWPPTNANSSPWTQMTAHKPKWLLTDRNIQTCFMWNPGATLLMAMWQPNNEQWHWLSFIIPVWWVTSQTCSSPPHWQLDDGWQHLSLFIDTSQWWHMRQQHRSMTWRPWNNDTTRMQDDNTPTHNDEATQWHTMTMTWNEDTWQQRNNSIWQQCGTTMQCQHRTTMDHPHAGMRLATASPSPFPFTSPFPSTSSPFPSTSSPLPFNILFFNIPLPSTSSSSLTSPFPSTPLFPYLSSLNIPLPFNTPLPFYILPLPFPCWHPPSLTILLPFNIPHPLKIFVAQCI